MPPGDNVTQKQFYDAMGNLKTDILAALDKVNDSTVECKIEIGKVQTKLDAYNQRINDNSVEIKSLQDQEKDTLRKAAGSGGVVGGLTYLLIKLVEFIVNQ